MIEGGAWKSTFHDDSHLEPTSGLDGERWSPGVKVCRPRGRGSGRASIINPPCLDEDREVLGGECYIYGWGGSQRGAGWRRRKGRLTMVGRVYLVRHSAGQA